MKRFFEQHEKVLNCHHLVISLIDIAKQRGIHHDKLLKGTSLFYREIIYKQTLISYTQIQQLVINCQKLINQNDMSFLVGSRLFPSSFNEVGNALNHCMNLAEMLRIIQVFQRDVFPFMFFNIQRNNDKTYFNVNYSLGSPNLNERRFFCELFVSLLINTMKQRLGYLPALNIKFPYSRPKYIEQYHAYLPCCYEFTGEFDDQPLQISLPTSELTHHFSDGNLGLKRHYLSMAKRTDKRVGLLQYILMLIENKPALTLEQLANKMHISSATLKRKLASHGTSFKLLHDQSRQQQAIFKLVELKLSNEQIARSMHFSDITNFRRAFKRWTGLTPSDFRAS